MDDEVELPWQRRGCLFGGGERKESPRPFRPTIPSVKPIPSSRPTTVGSKVSTVNNQQSSVNSLSVGTHILHNRFGRGEILRLEGAGDNMKATVQFENVGTKQLLLKFAKFEVID